MLRFQVTLHHPERPVQVIRARTISEVLAHSADFLHKARKEWYPEARTEVIIIESNDED